jgi:hypothetical protein
MVIQWTIVPVIFNSFYYSFSFHLCSSRLGRVESMHILMRIVGYAFCKPSEVPGWRNRRCWWNKSQPIKARVWDCHKHPVCVTSKWYLGSAGNLTGINTGIKWNPGSPLKTRLCKSCYLRVQISHADLAQNSIERFFGFEVGITMSISFVVELPKLSESRFEMILKD